MADAQSWRHNWTTWSGGRLHYLEAGSGKPLLLLHGGAADCAWRSWEPAPLFLPGFRLLAPDFPGFGESDLQAERVDVPFLVDSIRALLNAVNLPSLGVVGFSLGGLIAAHLALQQPERISQLVLVAAAGLAPGIPFRPWSDLIARFPVIHRVLYWGAGLNQSLLRLGLRRLVHDPKRLPPAFVRQTREMLRKPGAGESWRKFLQSELQGNHFRHEVSGALSRVQVPTWLVHGRHDRLVPVEHSRIASQQIPGSQLHILPDCGHWIHREDPDSFYSVIREALAGSDDSAWD